jgi:hypothetical protein
VPFSDVPVAGAVVTRPTETTTARSALTAAVRAPSRQQWSLIGGAALVLILLVVLVASIGSDEAADAEAEPADSSLVAVPAAAPEPVPSATQAKRTTARVPKAKKATPAKRTDKPTRTTAPMGQAVDLEELPVLSADATSAPSARSGATTTHRRPAAKAAPKTDGNIFNQAKNLAQKRATQRSGTVKTGSGD